MTNDNSTGHGASLPQQFRKKPVVIEAVQFTEALRDAILFDDQPCPVGVVAGGSHIHPGDRKVWSAHFYVETLEGRMRVDLGDWIITGVKGEHYPCKPDIFAATYEPAALTPSAPVAVGLTESRFLSDVMTAAGLVSHGKQCKALGERLGEAVMAIRLATPPATAQDAEIDAAFMRGFKAARAQFTATPPAKVQVMSDRPDWITHVEATDAMRAADAELRRFHDADDTLVEEGWTWDGDQWQRPAPPAQGAGGDSEERHRAELATCRGIIAGLTAERDALATQARPSAVDVRDAAPYEDIGMLLRDVLNMPGMNSITTPDYAVRVAMWLVSSTPPAAQGEKGVG